MQEWAHIVAVQLCRSQLVTQNSYFTFFILLTRRQLHVVCVPSQLLRLMKLSWLQSLARINTEQTSSLTPTNVRTPPVHRPCSPRMSPVKTPEHHWKGSEVDCDNFKLLQLQWVVAGWVPFSWSCVWRDNKADIDIDRGCGDGFVVLLPQVPHPLRPLPLVEVHPAFPRQDVALIQRRWKGTDW